MRKSPYRHKVRAHKRKNRPVNKYDRGKGNQPPQPEGRRRRVGVSLSKNPHNPNGGVDGSPYNVTIVYFDRDTEKLDVDATSYDQAMVVGIEDRVETKALRIIRIKEGVVV